MFKVKFHERIYSNFVSMHLLFTGLTDRERLYITLASLLGCLGLVIVIAVLIVWVVMRCVQLPLPASAVHCYGRFRQSVTIGLNDTALVA